MPENQASTLELLVGVARGDGPLQRQVEDQLRAAIRVGPPGRGRAPARLTRARGRPRRLARRGQRRLHAARGRGLADRRARAPAPARARRGSPRALRSHAEPGQCGSLLGSIPGRAVRYDLRPGRPDLARFPRADWLRSLSAAVRGAGVAELDYPPIAGAIAAARGARRLPRARARDASRAADDVILCAGAAQAFVTIAEALGPVKLAVEDPGHEGIRGLFAKRGLEPVPVRVDEHGDRRRRAARTTRAPCCSRPRTSSRPASCSAPSGARSCCAGRTSATR